MKVLAYGDAAVLLDCESLSEAQGWYAALEGRAEAVLGARSVLLRGDPSVLRTLIGRTETSGTQAPAGARIEVPVLYDGDDLGDVAALTGLSTTEVVRAHTGTPWTVGFGGFAPGFFYLVGGDPRLAVPRLDSPRARVSAGSVGLAGEFSGIYPRQSPGGWRLIGHTELAMWDTSRDRPALLTAGMTVTFVAR